MKIKSLFDANYDMAKITYLDFIWIFGDYFYQCFSFNL